MCPNNSSVGARSAYIKSVETYRYPEEKVSNFACKKPRGSEDGSCGQSLKSQI